MPPETDPNSTAAPAPPAPAAPPPASAVPPAPTPSGSAIHLTSDQLKERLDRAREAGAKDTLTALGVEAVEDGKSGLAELKKRREAEMTETDRLRLQNEELTPKANRTAELEAVIAERVTAELAGLTEMQRVAVKASAGNDPARQLRIIDALKPTWATAAPAQAAVAAAAAAPPTTSPEASAAGTPPKPNPGTTTPTSTSPQTGEQGTAPDHLAAYEQLQGINPMRAAAYRQQHSVAISAAVKKKRAAP